MKRLSFAFVLIPMCSGVALANPGVYSGYDVSFSRPAFVDAFDPANQDAIVDGVVLTRSTVQGLFNAASETSYAVRSSPAGTRWAFASNNPGETIAADNWAALTFEDWETSLGSVGNLATNILAGPGVLHLVERDIYLDIRFTKWGVGGGAGGTFAYERSAVEVVPEPGSLALAGVGGALLVTLGAIRGRRRVRGPMRTWKRARGT